jgi:predicted Fe-S protein YdhL (DUF1289 family)
LTASRTFTSRNYHTLQSPPDFYPLDPGGLCVFYAHNQSRYQIWKIMPVKSPCIGVCVLDPAAGYCTGCFRTGDEIGAWMGMSDGSKKRVLETIRKRRLSVTTAPLITTRNGNL